ncbi:MAG: DUF1015 domain-containing protein [Candidatus Omnitrophota bacterium]|jgi:uncharacterized protein (DUF1015 family)
MTTIKPFRAVIYNQEKISDLSSVVCPPYDIISPARQEAYQEKNPNNFTHILLSKDIPGEDKYRRAGQYFRNWLKNKVLVQDEKPAIYHYEQEYKVRGQKLTRSGFIALLHLEKKKSTVFGHEHTHLEPREDRLKLIRQVKANLSPIFVIFGDKKRVIQRVIEPHLAHKKPFLEVRDDEGIRHTLWRVDDPEILQTIQDSMSGENIFIADGHHRYEVSCAYRDEMEAKMSEKSKGEEDFNFTLAYFTNTHSHGLTVFPYHRLLKLDFDLHMDSFILHLKEYFSIEEMKDKARLFFLMEKAGIAEHVLGIYKDKRFLLLRLKNNKILDRIIGDKPSAYRQLDVCVLNYIVFRNVMGVDFDDKTQFIYTPDAEECIENVNENTRHAAFFLNPTKVEQITAIALEGEKMPPKSTYFYPKVLSGLVVNKHDE